MHAGNNMLFSYANTHVVDVADKRSVCIHAHREPKVRNLQSRQQGIWVPQVGVNGQGYGWLEVAADDVVGVCTGGMMLEQCDIPIRLQSFVSH